MKLTQGDRVVWFDYRLWGPRDIGNNDHCRKPATVIRAYTNDDGDPAVDPQFDHRPGRISHGHFNYPPYDQTAMSQKMGSVKS